MGRGLAAADWKVPKFFMDIVIHAYQIIPAKFGAGKKKLSGTGKKASG
jgi:hypothetical protein